jgi:opacity protein-like surface antigen
MKKHLLFLLCFTMATATYSQTKSFILTGGWAVALPNYSDASVNGFKLGGQWEKAVIENHWGWGIEADYINFTQTGPKPVANSKNRYHTIPLTLYGKYLIGNDKLQAYAKVGGGFQFSKISSEGPNLYASDNAFGIALTTGAGVYYTLSEYLYLNLDYEFLYITNASYNNGMINSVSLGIGFKMN